MLATCPSRTSLARIANKWTAMIVIALSERRMRFGELRTRVAGISGKVLTDTLRDLERDGIVTRIAFAEMPPRVEYELTALGRTLSEPLGALGLWAEQYFDQVQQARDAFDARPTP
ncbi:winged helix-turn-helix transcriptional regulator [Agromyces albus]|uniref:winged helix-turn-helix transcriptional regulator n=1 Tax=Agromyces albus TaxID=205332 RepID=UPI0027D7C57A|nr:helix-turn-helix domain-containing protein [Agromyces albus]